AFAAAAAARHGDLAGAHLPGTAAPAAGVAAPDVLGTAAGPAAGAAHDASHGPAPWPRRRAGPATCRLIEHHQWSTNKVDHGILLRSALCWASGFVRFGDPHPAPAQTDPAGAPAQQRAELAGGEVGVGDRSERHPGDLDLAGAGAGDAHAGRAAGWGIVRV